MDDASRDGTGEIVARVAAEDPRIRLVEAPPLPPDWTGKVHACARLAEAACGTHLLFIDADAPRPGCRRRHARPLAAGAASPC